MSFLDDTQLLLLKKGFLGNLMKLGTICGNFDSDASQSIFYQKHPFICDIEAFDNLSSLNTDFWAFIECGLNTSKCAKNIYVKGKDVLSECLVFDSCAVDSKEWFYSLATCGGPLNDMQANVVNKIPHVPIHRPITRKLAAQITNKRQKSAIKITKPSIPVEPIRNKIEDCIIIDVEDYKATGYSDVPMFVQHTEVMMEEIDRIDEKIKMEDAEDWSVVDIDSSNKKNKLAIVEYIDDIYAYYKKAEIAGCVPSNYMEQQFDINERMRGILIDWLIEVHYKFELMGETLYLTMNLIDRFLAVQSVIKKKLQLVGITALLLACKYEEVSVPVVEDLILISNKAYSRKEVLEMEKLMVNALQFNMTVPTTYIFMRQFLKASQSDKKVG
ncbi:hypothetical protein P3S68_024317 [Capsicum galapagoense]